MCCQFKPMPISFVSADVIGSLDRLLDDVIGSLDRQSASSVSLQATSQRLKVTTKLEGLTTVHCCACTTRCHVLERVLLDPNHPVHSLPQAGLKLAWLAYSPSHHPFAAGHPCRTATPCRACPRMPSPPADLAASAHYFCQARRLCRHAPRLPSLPAALAGQRPLAGCATV